MDYHKLTGRQRQILELLAAGKTNKEISAILGITENTVEYHLVKRIYPLLGVRSRSAAASVYLKLIANTLRKSGVDYRRQASTISSRVAADDQLENEREMSIMNFNLKSVTSQDELKKVYDFATSVLGALSPRHTLDFYREQLAVAPQLMVYAEHESRVIGCILARIDDDHVLVGPTAVDENFRRMGLGTAMMNEIERQTKALEHNTIILGAAEEAEEFYLARGFKPHLFVQFPEAGHLEQLKALNTTYDVAWEGNDDGWARILLRTPKIDKALQHRYDEQFPNSSTQTVFIKEI